MNTVDWEVLGSPDPHQLGLALERMASSADSVGADGDDVKQIRRLSYAAYVVGEDSLSADRVVQQVDDSDYTTWGQTRKFSFRSLNEIRAELLKTTEPSDLESVGDRALRAGNLKAAAALFAEAAAKIRREKPAQQTSLTNLAMKACLAYIATADYVKAREIRRSYKLSLDFVCSECNETLEAQAIRGNTLAGQMLANAATTQVLIKLDLADTLSKAASIKGTTDLEGANEANGSKKGLGKGSVVAGYHICWNCGASNFVQFGWTYFYCWRCWTFNRV